MMRKEKENITENKEEKEMSREEKKNIMSQEKKTETDKSREDKNSISPKRKTEKVRQEDQEEKEVKKGDIMRVNRAAKATEELILERETMISTEDKQEEEEIMKMREDPTTDKVFFVLMKDKFEKV